MSSVNLSSIDLFQRKIQEYKHEINVAKHSDVDGVAGSYDLDIEKFRLHGVTNERSEQHRKNSSEATGKTSMKSFNNKVTN